MREPLVINPDSKIRGEHSYRKLHGRYVEHLDVVDFDIERYWSYNHKLPGAPVRCYAKYSPINRDVILISFPGQPHQIVDAITRERAPYCQIVGSLYDDPKLVEELRNAEVAAGLISYSGCE